MARLADLFNEANDVRAMNRREARLAAGELTTPGLLATILETQASDKRPVFDVRLIGNTVIVSANGGHGTLEFTPGQEGLADVRSPLGAHAIGLDRGQMDRCLVQACVHMAPVWALPDLKRQLEVFDYILDDPSRAFQDLTRYGHKHQHNELK